MTRPRLGVVLVNWNRWADTLECLESLLAGGEPVRLVVVDNGSTDGSRERFAEWARGALAAPVADPAMARHSQPPARKPLALVELDAARALATDPAEVAVTVIDAGANLGFAAGNNLGIRHLLRDPGIDIVWLLNNDTVAEPGAAGAIVRRIAATHGPGMCGTQVRYYHRPEVTQALNGHVYNKWTGTSRGIGGGAPAKQPFDPAKVARETDFVFGASLAVTRAYVETVGLMEERYFLYFEEIDWAVRNKRRFAVAFAHGAVVYHKEGGSIGSSGQRGQRSAFSEYWLMRSRLRFVAYRMWWLLPLHLLVSLANIAVRLVRLQPGKAWAMCKGLLGLPY